MKEKENDSQRKNTKALINSLLKYNENVEKNIFKSATNINLDKILGYKQGNKYVSFLDDYDN